MKAYVYAFYHIRISILWPQLPSQNIKPQQKASLSSLQDLLNQEYRLQYKNKSYSYDFLKYVVQKDGGCCETLMIVNSRQFCCFNTPHLVSFLVRIYSEFWFYLKSCMIYMPSQQGVEISHNALTILSCQARHSCIKESRIWWSRE